MLSQVTAKNVGDVFFETHCSYTSLTRLTDRGRKGGVTNPWGKTLMSSTSLPVYPDSTQVLVLRCFGGRSSWLLICTALHSHFSQCMLCFYLRMAVFTENPRSATAFPWEIVRDAFAKWGRCGNSPTETVRLFKMARRQRGLLTCSFIAFTWSSCQRAISAVSQVASSTDETAPSPLHTRLISRDLAAHVWTDAETATEQAHVCQLSKT